MTVILGVLCFPEWTSKIFALISRIRWIHKTIVGSHLTVVFSCMCWYWLKLQSFTCEFPLHMQPNEVIAIPLLYTLAAQIRSFRIRTDKYLPSWSRWEVRLYGIDKTPSLLLLNWCLQDSPMQWPHWRLRVWVVVCCSWKSRCCLHVRY